MAFCIQQISGSHLLIKQIYEDELDIRGHEQDFVRALTLIIKMPEGSLVMFWTWWEQNVCRVVIFSLLKLNGLPSDGWKWRRAWRDSDTVVLWVNSKMYHAGQSKIYFLIISHRVGRDNWAPFLQCLRCWCLPVCLLPEVLFLGLTGVY